MVDRFFPYLFTGLMLIGMTVQTTVMSVLLAVIALLFSLGRIPGARFTSRLCAPVWGLLAFLVLNLAASLYSHFGAYAYGEYVKILASGSLGVLLLVRGKKEDVRKLLYGFEGVCAVIALLCLDFTVNGPLFRGFAKIMGILGSTSYLDLSQETYTTVRFSGIYNNANLTGSLFALTLLLGAYLLQSAASRKERAAAALLIGVCSVDFLASMSRGAILCFAVSCVVYLVAAGKGARLQVFFTLAAIGLTMGIVGTLVVTMLSKGSFLGTWVSLLSGVLLFGLLELFSRVQGSRFAQYGKVLKIGGLAVCLGCVVLAAAAMTMTKPFVFTEDNFLYRGADVTSGETYTVEAACADPAEIQVRVYGSTREEELQGLTTDYYLGPLSEAEFTVPDNVDHVLFIFNGPAGETISDITLSDGTEIPASYTLLPENIVSRFQKNLLQDSSFLLRVQYVLDGWTLFVQSPLIGHGLGATEGLLTSVQPFFYQSLYLHNHILQILDETGLLGAVSFLALMLGALWLLLKGLRGEHGGISAALVACWVMMNLHGLMELTFSVRVFQCAAFFLLLLIVVLHEPVDQKPRSRAVRWLSWSVAGCWLLVSGLLLAGNMVAQKLYADLEPTEMSVTEFLSAMEKCDRLAVYTDQDYKVNLMVNSLQQGGTLHMGTASRCARELRETGDFDACYYAAAYYDLPLDNVSDFFETLQLGLAQERSNSDAWNSAFNLMIQAFANMGAEDMDAYLQGVSETAEQMDAANAYLQVDIVLDEENQRFLQTVQSIQAEGMGPEEAQLALAITLQQNPDQPAS